MIIKYIKSKLLYLKYNKMMRKHFGALGNGSKIVSPLRLIGCKNVFIGENVSVLNNARIEAISSWKGVKYNPEVVIGNNTSFEQDLHLICANSVKIGSDCVISARVFISDLNHRYEDINTSVMKQALDVRKTEIEDGCFIGYGTCILPGVHLGKHCVVGANSVVTKSFPDYSVIAGSPAVCIKKYDVDTDKWVSVKPVVNFADNL